MKKAKGKKKPLRSRKHRRAMRKAAARREQDLREQRLQCAEDPDWTPPTEEELAAKAQERIERKRQSAEARENLRRAKVKERKAKRNYADKKNEVLSERLLGWMKEKLEKRKERLEEERKAKMQRREERAAAQARRREERKRKAEEERQAAGRAL